MNKLTIIHLDDNAMILHGTEQELRAQPGEFAYEGLTDPEVFLARVRSLPPDCVLLDIHLEVGGESGIDVLYRLRSGGYTGPVVVLSQSEEPAIIHAALRAGADEFVTKTEDGRELARRIALSVARRAPALPPTLVGPPVGGLTMRRLQEQLPKIIRSRVRSVLVRGETGTGKEVVSSCLRAALPPAMPLVPVNCAAIPDSMMEAELFGHERGAFTGAAGARKGLLAAAHGGWIFLDEVARLSLAAQAALLRTLESGEIRPVGRNEPVHVDVRVLAATNEDLEALAEAGAFRRDLFERLRGIEIYLPPLRDRPEEVPEILDALLVRLGGTANPHGSEAPAYRLAPAARAVLAAHDWRHGNVREMRQVLLAATVDAVDGVITTSCLPARVLGGGSSPAAPTRLPLPLALPLPALAPVRGLKAKTLSLPDLEGDLLISCLEKLWDVERPGDFNQRRVARDLGVTRYTLFAKLEGLQRRGRLPRKFASLLPGSKQPAHANG